jgi:hypothetical protein
VRLGEVPAWPQTKGISEKKKQNKTLVFVAGISRQKFIGVVS